MKFVSFFVDVADALEASAPHVGTAAAACRHFAL